MSPRRQAPLMIEHAVLGFVCAQPLHAYAVYQQLSAPNALGPVWPLKLSHFYALVAKLEQAGYLTTTIEPQGTRPARKVLHLTQAGAAAFTFWRTTPVEDPAQLRLDFFARLYFAERAGPAAVRGLLIAQRAACQEWRDALRAQLARRAGQPDAGIFLQLRARRLESFLTWIDRSLAAPAETTGVTYSIAVVANSPEPELAAAFVDYVRSARGQAAMLTGGFSPTIEALPERAPRRESLDADAPARTLTIFAAASLTAPFEAISAALRAAAPRVSVRFVFEGSYTLAARLSRGETADIFAPGHRQAMDLAVHAGRVWPESISTFAANQLAVITPRSNPAHLTCLDDLARPGLRLAFGSEATAVGQYTRELLTQIEGRGFFGAQGMDAVLHNVVRYGASVTEVLATVARGEVDAGIVFASDGRQAGSTVYVPIALPLLRSN